MCGFAICGLKKSLLATSDDYIRNWFSLDSGERVGEVRPKPNHRIPY
jgi:hypothetical protein